MSVMRLETSLTNMVNSTSTIMVMNSHCILFVWCADIPFPSELEPEIAWEKLPATSPITESEASVEHITVSVHMHLSYHYSLMQNGRINQTL